MTAYSFILLFWLYAIIFMLPLCLTPFFRIKQMEQCGILLKYQRLYWPPDVCAEKRMQASKTRALTLTDVLIVFIIFGVGIATATITILLEIISKTIIQKRNAAHSSLHGAKGSSSVCNQNHKSVFSEG